jgi:hypothetical protein
VALHFGAEAVLVDAGQPQLRIASRGDAAGELPRDGGGMAVGYEATGMVYTVGWMRGLMRANGLG